jgi:methionyl-tRNA formyltransferase
MNNPKIVFMGTPDFAVSTLDELLGHGFQIEAVVTAPDKVGGRGKNTLLTSEVKKYALNNNLRILQPEKLKDPDFVNQIQAIQPDFIVVVAFRMLPQIIWSIPKYGTINLHASLLPKYRGAAPIQWAIIQGENVTGVTAFYINEDIDCGKILSQKEVAITDDDDSGTLHDKLKSIGAKLIVETITGIIRHEIEPLEQDHVNASLAPKIYRETCKIDFNRNNKEIINFIRGLSPYPGAWTYLNEQSFKVFKAASSIEDHHKKPGEIFTDFKSFLKISSKNGYIEVLELQLEGKKKMNIKEFLIGHHGPMKLG